MPCPHDAWRTCRNCLADLNHADWIHDDAVRRQKAARRDREREQEYRERSWAKERDRRESQFRAQQEERRLEREDADFRRQNGGKSLSEVAGEYRAAERTRLNAQRAALPFNLYWYERVAAVGVGVLVVLIVLSELPNWLLLLGIVAGVVAITRYRARPFRSLAGWVRGFVSGTAATGRAKAPNPSRPGAAPRP
ncbi:hypothetical protein [Blastococcus sp. LR1]|uniref:hypothetical protein n=1 Tax=Blastococcus sp. LR1 TaxID=2877000 RepID=UPI001CC914D9|nr:hypothetical protein [Blastococcus sp. LR1]MCA0146668.1 hypothetical protein [Blastococcus sp. LR1]